MSVVAEHDDPAQDPAAEARLEQLRNEVARLETELGEPPADPPVRARGGWWRTPVVALCLLLVAITAPLAVVATWAHDQVGDTDRYVETVAPLAHDPAVQAAVSARISDALLERLDVRAVTDQAIAALTARGVRPGVAVSLRALTTPLVNGITQFVETQVTKLVESDAFAQAWEQANREAHAQMVAVLTGKGGDAVEVSGGTVSLNLAVVIDAVKTQLVDQGFTLASRIPEVTATFTLFESADLVKAQNGFRLLSAIARALPVIALLLLGAAVFVSRRRRRTLVIGSLVVMASMLVLGLSLNAFRSVYLGAIPVDQVSPAAAGAIYDRLVYFIRLNLRALLVLFLAVAAAAWVTGPEAAPSRIRAGTTRALDRIRHRSDEAGLDTGPFGLFLGTYRGAIRALVGGLVILLYVLEDHPTAGFTITLLLVAAVVLLLVELFARTPADPDVPAEPVEPAPQG
jgi:hypothetical protein